MAEFILTQTGQQIQNDLDLLDSNSATSGQVLTADGTGGASWQTPTGGGGSAPANMMTTDTNQNITAIKTWTSTDEGEETLINSNTITAYGVGVRSEVENERVDELTLDLDGVTLSEHTNEDTRETKLNWDGVSFFYSQDNGVDPVFSEGLGLGEGQIRLYQYDGTRDPGDEEHETNIVMRNTNQEEVMSYLSDFQIQLSDWYENNDFKIEFDIENSEYTITDISNSSTINGQFSRDDTNFLNLDANGGIAENPRRATIVDHMLLLYFQNTVQILVDFYPQPAEE